MPKAKRERERKQQLASKGQTQTVLTLKMPPQKYAPVRAKLQALRITENPEPIYEDIRKMVHGLCGEAFKLGVHTGTKFAEAKAKEEKRIITPSEAALVKAAKRW